MVSVPDLVGKTLEVAQQQLQAAGFEVDTQSYLPGRLVRAQSPAAGTSVNKGTKVTLFF
jgi:beta-lactam-binding protein with PASTA domain